MSCEVKTWWRGRGGIVFPLVVWAISIKMGMVRLCEMARIERAGWGRGERKFCGGCGVVWGRGWVEGLYGHHSGMIIMLYGWGEI
jgi:hypothetical protein